MRSYRYGAALAGLLAVCAPALAQTANYPAEAVIQQSEVEVRSGPSMQFAKTSLLKQNDKVYVLRPNKNDPSWLEISPPPGSFSWINAKYVKQVQGTYLAIVQCDPNQPVPDLPGSRLVNEPPSVEGVKLTQGTQVVLLGPPHQIGSDSLLPILPHTNEVRYIPASAVKMATVVAATNGPPMWTSPQQGIFNADATLTMADQARLAGNRTQATDYYTQVIQNSNDPSRQQYARNMIASMNQATYTPASRTVVSSNPPPTSSTNLIMQSAPAWTQYGRLRDVKLSADNGQPLYALEDNQGKTITYVTTNPGKSLVDYNGRMVSVYGPTMYRSDAVRMQYVVASYVAMP